MMTDRNDVIPPKVDCPYTPYYCEENIWKLCELLEKRGAAEDASVVIISNDLQRVPLWMQNVVKEGSMVIWDYHVILIRNMHGRKYVYDLNTKLDFPCDLKTYWSQTFRPDIAIDSKYRRYFRVFSALEYLKKFSSDRRHMKNAKGEFISCPPQWPAIYKEDLGHIFHKFILMGLNKTCEFAETCSEESFRKKYVETL